MRNLLRVVLSFVLASVVGSVLLTFAFEPIRALAGWFETTLDLQVWFAQTLAWSIPALVIGLVVRTLQDVPEITSKTYFNPGIVIVSLILGFVGLAFFETKLGALFLGATPVPLRTLFGQIPSGITVQQLYAVVCAAVGTLFLK